MAFREHTVKTENAFTQSITQFSGDIWLAWHRTESFCPKESSDISCPRISQNELRQHITFGKQFVLLSPFKNRLCILRLPTAKRSHLRTIKSQRNIDLIPT